jgi:geranylgeranyl pyrophosphate synthase
MLALPIGDIMNTKSKLMDAVKVIIEEKGTAAVERGREEILSLQYNDSDVSAALKYFAKVTLRGGLPVFPALISLACEAVGGKTKKTTAIGAAMTLLAAAADIHDDIIDQSKTKYSKKTVFGKFGGDIALLTGDALLIQGLMFLHRECQSLSKEQTEAILNLTLQAFVEISQAEAMETKLMRKLDTPPQEYFEIIRKKAVVPDVHCKIGAVLGKGSSERIKALGSYGRAFGIASAIREEFIDLLEYPELQNRLKKECPPLPILYALQDPKTKAEITPLLKSLKFTEKKSRMATRIILETKEVAELKNVMNSAIQGGIDELEILPSSNAVKNFKAIAISLKEDL